MSLAKIYPNIIRAINPSNKNILTRLNINKRKVLFFFPPIIPKIAFIIITEDTIQKPSIVPDPYSVILK